jgi:hypothetical protein
LLKGRFEFDSNRNLTIASNNLSFNDGVFTLTKENCKNQIYGNDTSFYLAHKKDTDDYAYLGFNSGNGIYLKGAAYGSTGENR